MCFEKKRGEDKALRVISHCRLGVFAGHAGTASMGAGKGKGAKLDAT